MTLTLDRSGERLDAAISRLAPEISRSQAQRLLEQGLITIAGKPAKKNDRLPAGTTLALVLPQAQETELAAQDIPFDSRYED